MDVLVLIMLIVVKASLSLAFISYINNLMQEKLPKLMQA
jgi:hypothetical protein